MATRSVALVLACLAIACAPARSAVEARDHTARALASRECRSGTAEERAARVDAIRDVLDVAPLVREESRKHGVESIVVGATMSLPATENVATGYLEHELECHESDVVLGKTAVKADDPFVLVDDWVDVRVQSAGTRIVIDLRPANERFGSAVVDRARAFGESHHDP